MQLLSTSELLNDEKSKKLTQKIVEHPLLGVVETALRIQCVAVVPPCPSYRLATTRHGYKPREMLPYDASKDARVDAWRLDVILIFERPAQ